MFFLQFISFLLLGTSAQWTSTSIMLPGVIYVGQETKVVVSTGSHRAVITYNTYIAGIDAHVDDVTTQYNTRRSPDGRYTAEIPYQVSFYPPIYESVKLFFNFTITFTSSVRQAIEMTVIKRLPPLILGETEKPIYRPGEIVRARFITINRLSTKGPLPQRKVIYTQGDRLLIQELTKEKQRDELTPATYTMIFVTDPRGDRVRQWLNLSPLSAASLTYRLLGNAPQGTWSITAERSGYRETVSFTMERYLLPRFFVTVVPPAMLSVHSTFANYSLCARYTTDLPVRKGTIHGNLCVCPLGAFKDQPESEAMKMLQAERCPKAGQDERVCSEASAQLSPSTGCVDLSLPLTPLNLSALDQTLLNYHAFFCALVEEDGTKSTVVQCHSGLKVRRSSEHISLSVPQFYHPNLPFPVRVVLTETQVQPIANISIRIDVTEQGPRCGRQLQPGPRFHHVADVYTDERGTATCIVPPVTSVAEWLLVSAEFRSKRQYRSQHEKVRIWQNNDPSVSLQLWPTNNAPNMHVSCPGEVKIRLMGNIPLLDKTFYVHGVCRGKHLMQRIPPTSRSKQICHPREDELGHYRCVPEGIHCLPGWGGDNCMHVECRVKCNLQGGLCVSGKLCLCRQGWSGAACETCIPRLNCLHGQCLHGNDCECTPGWFGQFCNEYLPTDNYTNVLDTSEYNRSIPEDHTDATGPRQIIFERDISIRVDSAWAPRTWLVIFFYTQKGFKASSMVGISVELTSLANCTTPAISLQSKSREVGVTFDRVVANPGQSVKLTIRPNGVADVGHTRIGQLHEDLSEQVCFSRISDTSLERMQNIAEDYISVERFAERMSQDKESIDKRDAFENGLTSAFRKAGIHLSIPASLEYNRKRRTKCKGAQHLQPSVDTSIISGSSPIDFPKPRLRDFFPEVWLFDFSAVEPLVAGIPKERPTFGVQRTLIVPDSLTTWKASVFCTTQSNGLWIGQPALLKVQMPFYIEMTLPKEVKRDEIVHLPVSIFTTTHDTTNSSYNARNYIDCFSVRVSAEQSEVDWEAIGATAFSGCLCSGAKLTYTLSLMAKRLGSVSVEVVAMARYSPCAHSERTTLKSVTSRVYSDRVRHSVWVIAEGTREETTVGDILCLSKSNDRLSRRFPIRLPENIVPDSLSVYLTYSDEILGPALGNLGKLIRLPQGCGEQNMISIAPNVYILAYLKAVPGRDTKRTTHLIRCLKSHIVDGYRKQLEFRRSDGSFSAFGESDGEGSTWLTAFIIRVFGRAYSVEPGLPIDWKDIFNTSIDYLFNQQDLSTGCFVENGRILHNSMQSSVNLKDALEKNISLTAHVISALHEVKMSYEKGTELHWLLQRVITRGLNCIDRLIVSDGTIHLSTHTIAQLAYAYTLNEPKSTSAVSFTVNLMQRRLFLAVGKLERFEYWQSQLSDNFPNWRGVEEAHQAFHTATAGDIEVTSLAYLAMVNVPLALSQLAPMIRWLILCQNFHGGFLSTQDTVLGLEAISDFATRLGLARSHESTDLDGFEHGFEITVHLNPLGTFLNYHLTEETHRTVNQIALLPSLFSEEVDSVEWDIVAEPRGRTAGCLSIQTSFIYHVRNDGFGCAAFSLRVSPGRIENAPYNKSLLEISLESRDNRETGMLLLIVDMITGWEMVEEPAFAQLGGSSVDALRKVEINRQGRVFLYFNGFSREETDPKLVVPKRRARLTLRQTTFVESPKPALVTAMDYYATHRRASTEYSLSSCPQASLMGGNETRDTLGTTREEEIVSPPQYMCPRCDVEGGEGQLFGIDHLYRAVCTNRTSTILIRQLSSSDLSPNLTVFTRISSSGLIATWMENLNEHLLNHCHCSSLFKNYSQLVLLGHDQDAVNFKNFSRESAVLPVEKALLVFEGAIKWWRAQKKVRVFNFTSSNLSIDQCNHVSLFENVIKSTLL